MSHIDRRLLRAACRIHSAYAQNQPADPRINLPEQAWEDIEAAFRRWRTACDRGWNSAASHYRESLTRELEHLHGQVRSRLTALQAPEPSPPPLIPFLYEELVAAAAEFEGVEFSEAAISVTTEPITLDDIELGPFRVRLHLNRLGTEMPLTVTALEPNPAGSCSETTHPHVHANRLCPGEGRAALGAAVRDGRLLDLFTIADRVLHTYAVGSAYVELHRWSGVSCSDCDSTMDEEDLCSCTNCEACICSDCLTSCIGCQDGHCSSCVDRCYRCEEFACSHCLEACSHCRRKVCPACWEEDLCETCREELEEEQDEDEADIPSDDPLGAPAESATEPLRLG